MGTSKIHTTIGFDKPNAVGVRVGITEGSTDETRELYEMGMDVNLAGERCEHGFCSMGWGTED
jgi:hypothetical protein